MKLAGYSYVTYLSKNVEEFENKQTNQKYKTYLMSVDQEGQAGSVKCTQEVFDFLDSIDNFKPVILHTVYNDQYKSYTVVGVQERQK